MMPAPRNILAILAMAAWALVLAACRHEEVLHDRKFGFDEFMPLYNRHIAEWIAEQQTANHKETERLTAEAAQADDAGRQRIEARLKALAVEAEKWKFRASLGDYLKIGKPEDVPANLVWQTGMDEPEIGDPAARKGGVFRRYIPTFPPTIRPFGENSNNSFRGDLYDMIDMPLVGLHPETMGLIPGIAQEWALSDDGRTVYFKLNPQARYSDGIPVRSIDFLVAVYVRVSDHIVNPYSKQFFRSNVAQLVTYGDGMLSVSLPEANLFTVALAGAMPCSPPHFYQNYGPDYSERYQWTFPPTTGAYEVLPEDIVKGASITQTRVKNWWARDLKYYRYRFNPDKIVHTVVRDESKAFELFRAGEIDSFEPYFITLPEYWYDKCEMDPVYRGYIERVTFYNRYPRIPRGLYLNVIKPPLDKRDVRVGIAYSMNWRKVIDQMFRGDYKRLNTLNEGYVRFGESPVKARGYSIRKAREAFRAAGFTEEDNDGILRNAEGTRLSISLTYANMPILDRMFAILREDAKACGLDLRLDSLESTVVYKKEMQKQHEMVYSSWLITPPIPDYHEFLHSFHAFDEKGNVKTQTNNIFSWSRPDTDALCETVRTGRTVEEVSEASRKLQQIIHDESIFVPAYTTDFVRAGYWRWVRWPDCENTHFCPPVVYDPHESFVYWIDEERRAETQRARRSGHSFGESTRIVDAYREEPKKKTGPDEPEQPGEPLSLPEP